MRQQLRLRALLPVAVLGLLGAGFGAWAFGQTPEPASSPLPPPTTTQAGGDPAPEPAGAVAPKRWAKQANAFCVKLNAEVEALVEPATPAELDPFLRKLLQISERADADFVLLGWPKGKRAAVASLRATAADSTELVRQALEALAANDLKAVEEIAARGEKLDREWSAEIRRLGANKCRIAEPQTAAAAKPKPAKKPAAPKTGLKQLAAALEADKVVVVVFYAPDSAVDNAAVREARAAALSADAGFLSVNAGENAAVSELAAEYEVLESPAVLVFVRGPNVSARFGRYVDRDTIAQAVENARS